MIPYASAYDEKNFGKLKDVYEQTIKGIKQMMINGNTSRFDGDLSVLFNCAKDIIEEIDVHEEEKKAAKEKEATEKASMERNEAIILSSNDGRKRKELDGKVRVIKLNSIVAVLKNTLYVYIGHHQERQEAKRDLRRSTFQNFRATFRISSKFTLLHYKHFLIYLVLCV
jgi:hypothetical protein